METIEKVARSASRDETRPILTGILVSAAGAELRMVATDSYRLSVKETRARGAAGRGGFEANVPARALQELRADRRQPRAPTLIRIGVRANQVVFEVGGAVLSSRLIDGQFPNYRQLLPESYEHELRIGGEELADVVERISLHGAEERAAAAELHRGRADGLGPDAGRRRGAASRCRCRSPASRSRSASTRSSCATAWTASAPSDLILKLISPLRPGLIEAADESGFLYLIMPIRLNV